MIRGRAVGVYRLRIQKRAHLAQRVLQIAVGFAVYANLARRGLVQAHDHPHGGGFAGTIGPQEAGDHTGLYLKGEILNGADRPVVLSQSLYFNHEHYSAIILDTLPVQFFHPLPQGGKGVAKWHDKRQVFHLIQAYPAQLVRFLVGGGGQAQAAAGAR